MAQPGWYPDPSGMQGQVRFWDGNQWSQETRPAGGPGGPVGPVGPGGPSGQQPKKSPVGLIIGLGALVVALIVAAVFLLPRLTTSSGPQSTNTSEPTVSSWNESESPTPSTQAEAPCPSPTVDPEGWIHGGFMKAQLPSTWTRSANRAATWASCWQGGHKSIKPTWVSEVILATVKPGTESTALKDQAEEILTWLQDAAYSNVTKVTTQRSAETTIKGLKAWQMNLEIRVDRSDEVQGDVVEILLIEDPAKGRTCFITAYTIGDTGTKAEVDKMRASLTVE